MAFCINPTPLLKFRCFLILIRQHVPLPDALFLDIVFSQAPLWLLESVRNKPLFHGLLLRLSIALWYPQHVNYNGFNTFFRICIFLFSLPTLPFVTTIPLFTLLRILIFMREPNIQNLVAILFNKSLLMALFTFSMFLLEVNLLICLLSPYIFLLSRLLLSSSAFTIFMPILRGGDKDIIYLLLLCILIEISYI